MSVYKKINRSGISSEKSIVHHTQNLDTGSEGLSSIQYVSGSISSSHWSSIQLLYYTSGSPILQETGLNGLDKWDSPNINFSNNGSIRNKQYVNKFHGYPSGSIISIPQQYFGEEIKPKTFELTDLSYKDNSNIILKIKDDGKGNLYSTNAHHSQSAASSISSSDNYVGNIYYDTGLAIITETGSWSGSVNYSQVTSQSNYKLQFDSTHTIYTNEYTIEIHPSEYNNSTNYTLRCFLKNSDLSMPEDSASILSNPYLCADYTGSEFQPYITTIGLYSRTNIHDPVIVARLPEPLRVSDKVTTTIKLRLDM
tara:strand:+ start:12596 stop:13525 length:930 start_codon:yes stop_codon:yes gene_type:complete